MRVDCKPDRWELVRTLIVRRLEELWKSDTRLTPEFALLTDANARIIQALDRYYRNEPLSKSDKAKVRRLQREERKLDLDKAHRKYHGK